MAEAEERAEEQAAGEEPANEEEARELDLSEPGESEEPAPAFDPADPQGPGEGGMALPPDMPPEFAEMLMAQAEEEERRARMFIKDEKHVNCPVTGCRVLEDGSIEIAYEVGPNHFHSYRIGDAGQNLIGQALQQAQAARVQAGGLVIANGPLASPTDQPPGPQQR